MGCVEKVFGRRKFQLENEVETLFQYISKIKI